MHSLILNNATLAYHDVGDQDSARLPVLLMHGFTGTARSHLGPLIDRLAAERRVIAPDLRGYGASRPPDRDFPPDFYVRDADDMAALLDALELKDIQIAGFSDGAEVALLLAARRPDLARSVCGWGVSGVIAPEMLRSVETWLPVEEWSLSHAAWHDEIVATQGEDQVAPMIEGWVGAARAITAAGGDISLGSAHLVRCPTLLMNGDGEVGNPLYAAQMLASRIPRGELRVIPNSGHAIHEDQPELFWANLSPFLHTWDPAR